MRLKSDWKNIARKAWSFRLLAVAGLLSAGEMVLPLFVDAFPRGIFAILTFGITMAALFARVIAQKDFE